MKPKNFPGRKLCRQLEAKFRQTRDIKLIEGFGKELEHARRIRTKKYRGPN